MRFLSLNLKRFLSIIVFLLIIVLVTPFTTLRVVNVNTNEILIEKIMINDPTFKVKWIHSVELTPWEEAFSLKGNTIYLESTSFQSFGAGVPDAIGEETKTEDGYVTYSAIHKEMPNLVYGISPTAKHELQIGTEKPVIYKLYELLPADTGLSFEAHYVSLINRLIN